MSDEVNIEVPVEPVLPEGAEGVAGPLAEIDPEKLRLLEERLKEFKANQARTASGSEAPDATVPQFDSSKWEVEPELEHLYQRATLEETPEGQKWVVLEHQYLIHSGQWHVEGSGQPRLDNAGHVLKVKGKTQYHAKGLDHIITDIVNGPDGMLSRQRGWRLQALLPGQMGQGVAVFEREVKRTLPNPKPIVDPNEVPLEDTTDEELARMQERAKGWTEGEGSPVETGQPDTTHEGTSDPTAAGAVEESGTDGAVETTETPTVNEGGN